MEGFNQERRGLFDGLKVPFDVNAILLSAVAVIVFLAGIVAIQATFHMPWGDQSREWFPLVTAMFQNVTSRLGWPGEKLDDLLRIPHDRPVFDAAVWIAFLGWFSVVWAFFSGAVCRIAAMKIAREEGLELRDALKFGASKFVANLLSIVFVVGLVGFFYLICNSTIAGWIGRIPWVGDLLVGLLFFLVLLSSFFIVFAGALGILGFNLASAAIATEASDTFDGVSRAWNYILARPWTVILTYALTFGYIGIFVFCAHIFEKVTVKSLSVSGWGMGMKPRYVEPDPDTAATIGVDARQKIAIPGRGEYLYRQLVLKDPAFNDHDQKYQEGKERLFYPQMEPDAAGNMVPIPGNSIDTKIADNVRNAPEGHLKEVALTHQKNREIDVNPAIESGLKMLSWVVMGWLLLAKLIIVAYAVSYFFSSMTTIYFLLRKDVEGDDYTEINLEEDEDEDEAFSQHDFEKKPTGPSAGGGEGKALPLVGSSGPEKKDEPKP